MGVFRTSDPIWASYQIRKIAGCACAANVSPRHRAWRTCLDACRDRLPAVAFPVHAHPQFYVSGKRPMVSLTVVSTGAGDDMLPNSSSHYLSKYQLIIIDALWQSLVGNFTGNMQDIHYCKYKYYTFVIKIISGREWLHTDDNHFLKFVFVIPALNLRTVSAAVNMSFKCYSKCVSFSLLWYLILY